MTEDEIVSTALKKTVGAERTIFLTEACGLDEDLRRRVEARLRSHEETPETPDPPPERTAPYTPPIDEQAGTRIGPYVLREQIGEGGFGRVFVAEQTEPVRRKVALKLIKPGMDSGQVVARFEAERRALALMDHPNIARVLDAGATSAGRPYFVMELVRGIPITDYCDRNHLAVLERLELFVTVCQAIQHAHQKGIIHRDIKPSNVLVALHDGKPLVKVIDFGVAKAIHQPLTDRTIYTNVAQMIGTPLYMSPEQAEMSALDIDTRSDVYALGVLLYELLTGTTPLERKRFAQAAHDEIRRLIREEEPPRPSARLSTSETVASVAALRHTEPAKLSRLVRGDLDWITMKCLEKDRTRRYETANGLARDVQRYLSDEPVEACPPSVGYRLRKFARKNRVTLITAAAFATLLVVGSAVATWQAVRATRAERAARAAQALAESNLAYAKKGNELLGSIFSGLDPKANYATVGEFSAALKKNLFRAVEELEGSAIGDPLTVADMQDTLGTSLVGLGEPGQAITLFQKARATRARLLGADHLDTITSMSNLALGYLDAAKPDLALPLLEGALKLRKVRMGPDHPDTITSMSNLAAAYLAAGKPDLALPMLEEALKLRRARLGTDHPITIGNMNNLAVAYHDADKLDLALPMFEETLKLRRAKLGPDHPNTLTSMNNLAGAYQYAGKLDLALPLMEEALRLTTARLGSDHPDTIYSMSNLASSYQDAGKLDLALPLFRQAAVAIEQRRFQHKFAVEVIPYLTDCLERLGQFDEAEAWRRKWLAVIKDRSDPDSIAYTDELAALGLNLLHQKKWIEAETTLTECLAIRRRQRPNAWDTFNTQSMLGEALLGLKKYTEAEPLLRLGREGMMVGFENVPASHHWPEAQAAERLARLYEAQGKPDEAAKWRKEAGSGTEAAPTPGEKK